MVITKKDMELLRARVEIHAFGGDAEVLGPHDSAPVQLSPWVTIWRALRDASGEPTCWRHGQRIQHDWLATSRWPPRAGDRLGPRHEVERGIEQRSSEREAYGAGDVQPATMRGCAAFFSVSVSATSAG